MTLTLRDYQDQTLDRSTEAEGRGIRRQLWVAATGLGKTVMFVEKARRAGGRTLILAHREELIGQAAAKVLDVWPELGATDTVLELLHTSGDEHLQRLARTVERQPTGVGIVKAGANDVHAHVVIGSIQTLAKPRRLQQLIASTKDGDWSLAAGLGKPFALVIVDEAHHATASSYRAVLDALGTGKPEGWCWLEHSADLPCPVCNNNGLPAGPLLVGVTATPDRGDGKGLDDLFDEIVTNWDILWGIRAGYLSDLRGLRVKLEKFNPKGLKVSRGDYEQGAAGAALMDAGAPEWIVKAWLADHRLNGETVTARDRKTLVFTPTVAMAREVAHEYVAMGVKAAWVSGETPTEDRRRLLADFHDGSITVLANCAVLTEGYDEPSVGCIVQARPTKSRALYTQMIGRGTRRHPDKDYCLVLDVVGSTSEHSLVTIPSLLGVDPQVHDYHDGESLTAVLDRQDKELLRLGRITAEEADLFAKVRSAGLAWAAVHQTGALGRYIINLGRDVPTVVLAQREHGDVWTAGLQNPDGSKVPLIVNVPMETAQGVAEDWVRSHAAESLRLVDTDAAWRKRKPTPNQVAAAGKWKMTVDPKWTAGELSDALNAHIDRRTAGGTKRRRRA